MDQQLLAFLTVADEQNFTRAAEKLHVSQPAISQHIQHLEQRLNVQLLDRTHKSVRLTQAGVIVYRHAMEILNQYRQMERHIEDLTENASGPLSIGASFTFGEYVLPHVVAEFRQAFPNISPTISIGNTQMIAERLTQGDIDIGIIEGHTSVEGIVVDPFAEDTVAVVASSRHPLTRKKRAEAEEIARETWIVRESGSGTREITDLVLHTHGIHPQSLIEYGSTQVIKESVEAGLGITILSKWVIRKELKWNTLGEIRFTDEPIHRDFSIVLRKADFQTKATQLFAQFLRDKSAILSALGLP